MIRQSSSAVVINRKGEILLQLRADVPVWCLPGGGRDSSETPEQTAVRETFEETGLRVRPERLVGRYLADYLFFKVDCHVFLCRITGGKLEMNKESSELGFFSTSHLPRPILYFHREMILDALSGLKNAKRVQKLSVWRILKDVTFSPVVFLRLFLFSVRTGFQLQKIFK